MTFAIMCSTITFNSLISVLKFTTTILLPKYNSDISMLFKIILKQHTFSKQKGHILKLKPLPEHIFMKVLPINEVWKIGNVHSCIIVGSNTLKTFGVESLSWCKILIKLGNTYNVYVLQVVSQPELEDNVGIISSLLHYNLNKSSAFVSKSLMAEEINMMKNFVPHFATSVKVGLLQSINTEQSLIDTTLSNYFECPHYLQTGDTFGIDLFKYAPFNYQNFLNRSLFVKVMDIEGNHYTNELSDDTHCGYYVQKEYSSLIQCENQQGFSPNIDESYIDELVGCIAPFIAPGNDTSKLKPVFLLTGAHGIGKGEVVKSVCEALGLYLWDFDSFELQGGSPGHAEGRLKYVFNKVEQLAPCMLVISSGEVLCKDKNGNEDERASNAFIDEVQKLYKEIVLPVVIVVTCNSKDGSTVIAPALSRMFLHSIDMETPDDSRRLAMLEWLLKKHGMRTDGDLTYIISQTSGYLYADLVVLLSLALRNMYKHEKINFTEKQNSNNSTLTKPDFDEALNAMQATYSVAIDAPKIPKVSWDDIGGLLDLKREITRTVMLPLQRPELLAAGLRRSGILLYGPPGTGKTLLAKAIATECKLNFLSVKGPELLNMYVGQSEENVREVFERARAASPCIIFFDELDSLAPNRGKSGDSGGVMDRVVSQMLAELDGLQKSKLLFVIGATNRPDLIDPALLRPGRFEKLLYVGVCEDKKSQLSVMQTLTKRFKLQSDVVMEDVVCSLPNKLTGADMYSVCSHAWLTAVRNHIHCSIERSVSSVIEVGTEDFKAAINYLLPSVSDDELVYYHKMKQQM
ncbi:hypothetical protein L9F63_018290 [Diploptera punctata]|uniref:Peroxisomal ATPase PEX6 n=1 Tax=Diploptera punctata TaxID=6984 RepID=A0AAD7ZWU4_DIPPU|nr:hypothetical protein L9F63_018290 [Diploptera punctata]